MGGLGAMAAATKSATKTVGGGLSNLNDNLKKSLITKFQKDLIVQTKKDGLVHEEVIDTTNNVIDDLFLNSDHCLIKNIDKVEQKDIKDIDEEIY